MNKQKLIGSTVIGIATLMLSAHSHAEGRVFGNLGIEDAPWSILIGYNDYGRHYYEPRHVEHHHYYHKPRHYYKRGHGHGHGHRRGHGRHHYKHAYDQRRHHDRYYDYDRRH